MVAWAMRGHFDSDEFQGWVGEMGQQKTPARGGPRRTFASIEEETADKSARSYGGENYRPAIAAPVAHNHFGTVLVSCDRADLRAMPNGVMIYENGSGRLDALPPPVVPRSEVIDELYRAVVDGEKPLHDGAWAMGTMQVILAMLRSAREGREVALP